MRNWILPVVLIAMAYPSNGNAQSKDDLVGNWKLVSATDMTDKGEVRDAYGPHPTGFITHTADGRMMAIITNEGRKPLSVPDHVSAPTEQRAEAFATLVAYAGTYKVIGDKVIHHVEAAGLQNLVNMDLVRSIVKLEGNRVTLRTTPFSRSGVHIVHEDLFWERMKQATAGQ
jgi:hypothetical protein